MTLVGCGSQGRIHLESLLNVLPLEQVNLVDVDEGRARALAEEFSGKLSARVASAATLARALQESDICVTCTTSKRVIVNADDVPKGMFLAGVGADNEEKQELDPRLFPSAKIVTDLTEQCAAIGDLHHALARGLLGKTDVYAELGEVVAGRKAGRESDDETIIFDSTGTALQDVAAASLVYERALEAGVGTRLELNPL
jgi:ornithine cyclodeaminase/alanine dehydrogenase-like protein (mu-crystallin family)